MSKKIFEVLRSTVGNICKRTKCRYINKGFSVKNLDVYRNDVNFDVNFINEVITTKDKSITEVYLDNNDIYFGYVKLTKKINEDNENFVNKDIVRESVYSSINRTIQQEYSKYLKNTKHKVKVNYKLLDLIK